MQLKKDKSRVPFDKIPVQVPNELVVYLKTKDWSITRIVPLQKGFLTV